MEIKGQIICLGPLFTNMKETAYGRCFEQKFLAKKPETNSAYPDQTSSKEPGTEVIKLFSCSTQLSTKFQLLIKAKIPTNEEVSCFISLRCCIYHANKC